MTRGTCYSVENHLFSANKRIVSDANALWKLIRSNYISRSKSPACTGCAFTASRSLDIVDPVDRLRKLSEDRRGM